MASGRLSQDTNLLGSYRNRESPSLTLYWHQCPQSSGRLPGGSATWSPRGSWAHGSLSLTARPLGASPNGRGFVAHTLAVGAEPPSGRPLAC